MTDNVTRLPDPGVILDLDTEERPSQDVKPAFVVNVGGRKITLEDPSDINWIDLAAVEIPADLLRVAMSKEDRKHLSESALPAWKFNRLMESYYTHYDLEEKIRNAKRQAGGVFHVTDTFGKAKLSDGQHRPARAWWRRGRPIPRTPRRVPD